MKNDRVFTGAVLVASLFMAACGGSGGGATGGASTTPAPTAQTAPMLVTVADAPLSNLLSAQVTISSVSLVPQAGGSAVPVLTQPETVELSGLGTLQEPLELAQIPVGTYSQVQLVISAVTASYIDPVSGKTVTNATATVANGNVQVTLNPVLSVSQAAGADLHLDVNLAKSLDLTSGTLTFTPTVTSAAAKVESESETSREVEVKGPVTAVSATSITVQSGDSKKSFQFAIGSSTQFSGNLTLAALQTGNLVHVQGTVQADGSLLASSIELIGNSGDGGDAKASGGDGMILATTQDSTGAVTSFQMVLRDGFGDGQAGAPVTVDLSASTNYELSEDATKAGLTSFDASQIFPGQSVEVTGTPGSNQDIAATDVKLVANTLRGQLASAVSGTAPAFSFSFLSSADSAVTKLTGNASFQATTTSATEYEDPLTASTFASVAKGANLVIRAFMTHDATNGYALVVIRVKQSQDSEGD